MNEGSLRGSGRCVIGYTPLAIVLSARAHDPVPPPPPPPSSPGQHGRLDRRPQGYGQRERDYPGASRGIE